MYELAILLWGHTQSKLKFEKIHASQNSFQHYLQQSLHGSKLNSHQQMTGWKKVWCIYTQWNIIQPLKQNEIMPFAAMGEPRDYHNEWSKPDRERQVSYDMAQVVKTHLQHRRQRRHRFRKMS